MGDYARTTRECTLASLHPTLATSLRAHVQKYELGDGETAVLICCETVSTRSKKGLFGRKTEVVHTAVLVTPTYLIWATAKDNETPGVLSARLRDVQVQDYERSELYKLVPDSGLNITGLFTNATAPGSSFIGLGPEPAAQKLRTVLKEAVANA